MIRLAEVAVFLAPLAAFALWQTTVRRGVPGPSPQTMVVILVGLLIFGAALAYFGVHERDPAGTRYVPAELKDGRIVPGHGT